jgi:hypothetical protein
MFHMANDSDLFKTQATPNCLPLFEAKLIHQYDHRFATYEGASAASLKSNTLPPIPTEQKLNQKLYIKPRYWISSDEVEKRLGEWKYPWLLAFRSIARSTDERTLIAAIIPRSAVSGKLPLALPFVGEEPLAFCFLANLNSIVLDFITRQKVGGTDLAYHYIKQLPVLPPSFYRAEDVAYVASRVLELVYTADDMQPLADALRAAASPLAATVPRAPYRWDETRRALLRSELDAWYARAYGLTRDELRYILDPADVHGPDFPGETFRVLKEKETAKFGEYRTRRLVLEAWDRLASVQPVTVTPAVLGILDLPLPKIPASKRLPMDTPNKYVAQFIFSTLKLNAGQMDARLIAEAFSLVSSRKLCEDLAKIQFDRLGRDWIKTFNENTRPELFREILCELYDKDMIGLADRDNKPMAWIKMSDPVPPNEWVELDAILSARLVANVPEDVRYENPVSMPSNTQQILERVA